jgi:DNA-binding CsgD family transcriptional regulator
MAAIATRQLQALTTAVSAAAEAHDFSDLGSRAFPLLGKALGACAALMFEVGSEARPRALAGEALSVFPWYLQNIAPEDPLFRASAIHCDPVHLPVRHAGRRVFRASRAYNDFYRANGFDDKLYMRIAGARLDEPGAVSMGFLRARGAAPFTAREVDLAMIALSAFRGAARRIAAGRAARDRQVIEALACTGARDATMVLDARGRLLWASTGAATMCGLQGLSVPAPLHEAARRLGLFAVTGDLDPTVPLPFAVAFAGLGGASILAELSIVRTASGEPMVVIGLDRRGLPRDLVHQAAACFELTPSEADVLGLLARGLSNKQIGARLQVSIATVKSHVNRVLAKMGADSRLQAALLARRLG